MKAQTRLKLLPHFLLILVGVMMITPSVHSELTSPYPGLIIAIEPQVSEIQVGETCLLQVFADQSTDLISMGVTISFDPAVLQVVSASKNTDFITGWVMDADGDPGTTGDQYTTPSVEIDNTAGTVTMLGGRLIGTSTTGLSGKVLLGEITFESISSWDVSIFADVARYHPQHPDETFDNFVRLDGTVDEPGNVPGIIGYVHVGEQASSGVIDEPDFESGSQSIGGESLLSKPLNQEKKKKNRKQKKGEHITRFE